MCLEGESTCLLPIWKYDIIEKNTGDIVSTCHFATPLKGTDSIRMNVQRCYLVCSRAVMWCVFCACRTSWHHSHRGGVRACVRANMRVQAWAGLWTAELHWSLVIHWKSVRLAVFHSSGGCRRLFRSTVTFALLTSFLSSSSCSDGDDPDRVRRSLSSWGSA